MEIAFFSKTLQNNSSTINFKYSQLLLYNSLARNNFTHMSIIKNMEENEKLAKRTKTDPQPKLPCRSNQVQYEFNISTVTQLDDVSNLLKKKSMKKGSWNDKKSNGGHKN